MKQRHPLLACITSALVTACATSSNEPSPPGPAVRASPWSLRIEQVPSTASAPAAAPSQGGDFFVCNAQTCPRVTPKTLAVLAPTNTPREPTPSAVVAGNVKVDTATPAAQPEDIVLAVHFGFGDAQLTSSARALLDDAARQAEQTGALQRLHLVGRTDNFGPQSANDGLALARARAVRDYLRSRLTSWPPAVDVEAAGVCCYAAGNDTAQGRQSNRRVEVTFSASQAETLP